jgi:RND family efflux transporter MFP subunit
MKQSFCKLCFLVFSLNIFNVSAALGQKVGFNDPVSPDKIYGKLRSQHTTSLSSEIPTRIEKLLVREGNSFKKGAILIMLDCSLIRARYEKLEAILKAAKAKLSIETRLLELNSTGELDLKNAEAEMGKITADMKAGHVKLSKCIIKAPFSGRVVEVKMGEHQFAKVGVEIIKIIDDFNLEIVFMVPSGWVSWLKRGSTFQYLVDETSRSYSARIVQRGAQIDAISRSIVMIGATIKRHKELIPGMSGIVKFKLPVSD